MRSNSFSSLQAEEDGSVFGAIGILSLLSTTDGPHDGRQRPHAIHTPVLTSQQFLRASALMCAMEIIREDNADLGEEKFTIGIWVGGSTTPNTRDAANAAFKSLAKGKGYGDNPFLVLRCPWCAAQMGVIEADKDVPKSSPRLAGYRQSGGTVEFRCPDRQCPFRRGLPVYVVDEDVYEYRPSIVIGTVDKFAMLAFRPKPERCSASTTAETRICEPAQPHHPRRASPDPGPLGSMVGLYEPIIEGLCTRPTKRRARSAPRSSGRPRRSVGTRADQGPLRAADAACFLRTASTRRTPSSRGTRGTPGRTSSCRVGCTSVSTRPGLGSIQTAQVRTGATLLQAASICPSSTRPMVDTARVLQPLRELGTSLSLLQSDIPDYLVLKKRLPKRTASARL